MSENDLEGTASPLSRLRDTEKAAVLDELAAADERVSAAAEASAWRRLEHVDENAVAVDVAEVLGEIPQEELVAHAGPTRYGYVEPTGAAWGLLQRGLDPWIDDIRRRAAVGLREVARRLAVAVVDGLHRLEPLTTNDTRLLSWAPEFPAEAAQQVLQTLDELMIDRPHDDLKRIEPDWA